MNGCRIASSRREVHFTRAAAREQNSRTFTGLDIRPAEVRSRRGFPGSPSASGGAESVHAIVGRRAGGAGQGGARRVVHETARRCLVPGRFGLGRSTTEGFHRYWSSSRRHDALSSRSPAPIVAASGFCATGGGSGHVAAPLRSARRTGRARGTSPARAERVQAQKPSAALARTFLPHDGLRRSPGHLTDVILRAGPVLPNMTGRQPDWPIDINGRIA